MTYRLDGIGECLPGRNVLPAEVGGFPVVLYDESVVVNELNVEGVVEKVKGRRLLSADWAYLIKDNETTRVTAECHFKNASQCSWRIHASVDKSNDYCYIRSYNKHHQCGMFFGTTSKRRLNSVVIIDLIENDIRAMPAITPCEIQSQVKDKFGIDISYWVAWRATDAGRKRIFGDETSSYSYLPSYFDETGKTNPGSIFHLDVERVWMDSSFVVLLSCVVMLDGTFFKGRYKGVLLSAVGKDVDEGLFPIAFAIVSEETDSNWAWFLSHFKDAIGNDMTLNFNKLKYRFRGVPAGFRETVLQQFAACAYATTKEEFDRCIDKLKTTGGTKVCNFLDDLPKEKWSNVYCEGHRYGQMTSNGCESWNRQIKKQRHLPITSLIDGIRLLLMTQLCKRLCDGNKWTTVLCEKTEKRSKEAVDKGRSWICKRSSMQVFEVFSSPNDVVDLGERTCSCRLWKINGFPCAHPAAVIFVELRCGLAAYDYIDRWYHRSTFKESYSGSIIPFVRQVSDLDVAVIGPPEVKPTRGCPKRKRIPSQGCNMCWFCLYVENNGSPQVRNNNEGIVSGDARTGGGGELVRAVDTTGSEELNAGIAQLSDEEMDCIPDDSDEDINSMNSIDSDGCYFPNPPKN
ncbi:PREDICTED: uncharacterized protein LOC105972771 [Erythranthe guttata]|uniref:uncharacterized protein LOC105972771 n=1 Tax=Erythranthe guttata TaxID=4155 RepID=UPI00064D804F|nr:PREDICTED: uncharacterized protein LOC105972771 [Erythranthe guttata]|eukprot:XP_012853205.1 PREDICTED: uncharacterized protein LOC105972771 [Erythranthe guttata]